MADICICCPVCHAPLFGTEGGYRCGAGHNFDRARRGYTNLLLTHTAGQHGDNAEMIRARRDFLDGGYYAPLCRAVTEAAVRHTPDGGVLLDAGCGECYYTDAVMQALRERGVRGVGLDISREALCLGGSRPSVREGRLLLFAAGVYEMPLPGASVDTTLNLFAPLADAEYRRVLRPGGYLIMAIPAARHLWELKELLYDTPYENRVQDFALPGFLLEEHEEITTAMTLPDQKTISALFSMTPYYYRTPRSGRARLEACDALRVTAAFHLLVYRLAP